MSLSVQSAARASAFTRASSYCCVANRRCPSMRPPSADAGAVNGAASGVSRTAAAASSRAERPSPPAVTRPRRAPCSARSAGLLLLPGRASGLGGGPTAQKAGASRSLGSGESARRIMRIPLTPSIRL